MKYTLEDRLMRRELSSSPLRYTKVRGIYGSRSFIDDLEVVNELNGHSGCVNALSWSRSGRLLASGSDDKVINIYSYLPDYSNNQFDLATQIDTGHSRNIFSVKFMPHSNDRTIVSAAGDAQIRVFDIERSAVTDGTRNRLSQSQANGKVFRSHSAAVKRIVTEASPFYFLSCSEDGDVRQWDIRQPESTYPRSVSRYHASRHGRSRDDAPPALISYQDYNIDLMTISCSPSQPHYIALGGTALHCFLHDRRMLGRDKLKEKGSMPNDSNSLEEATRCVRKFAPYGQPEMRRSDPKSITACKISDANPNELIASWNGGYIYKFDILRDDQDQDFKVEAGFSQGTSSGRVQNRADKKRKRMDAGKPSQNELDGTRSVSRPRTDSTDGESNQRPEMSLLFQLENGQSMEVPIPSGARRVPRPTTIRSANRSEGETIAQQVRFVRNIMSNTSTEEHLLHRQEQQPMERVAIRNRMHQVMASGLKIMEKIDALIADWTYPLTESRNAIAFQQKLREDRAKTWRFVQACGTIARVVERGAPEHTPRTLLELFDIVKPAPRESSMPLERHEQFGYDFIKTVLLWLESGLGAVLREFSHDSDDPNRSYRRRRPLQSDVGVDAIETELIPYLERMASQSAVDDIDDGSESSYIFQSEADAVRALARAMNIPFADLAGRAAESDGTGKIVTQDRETATRFWGYRVCRSILKNAAIDVTYSLVDTAFGERMGASYASEGERGLSIGADSDENMEQSIDDDEGEAEFDGESGGEEEEEDEDEEEEELEDEDEASFFPGPRGARPKTTAGKDVPCITHSNYYEGHCNVETTKDVNFFGLRDEYVISGSDCGNIFIWDKKTSKLLNILEGDGEVVNVLQGHPYEPMLAVSGIDNTIKIFSPDGRARKDACLGMGVEEIDRSTFSSIGLRGRRERRRMREGDDAPIPDSAFDFEEESAPPAAAVTSESAMTSPTVEDDDAEDPWYENQDSIVLKGGLKSRKRMQDSYQITSRNDMERRRGARQGGFITRGMLAMLAQHMRTQNAGGTEDDGETGDEGGDNCVVM